MGKSTVKARVFKATPPTETTKQIYEDEFQDVYGDNVIAPPYNLKELKHIAEYSTILQQCVDAYKTNIVGFGFEMKYSKDINSDEVDPEEKRLRIKNGSTLKSSSGIFILMRPLKHCSDSA